VATKDDPSVNYAYTPLWVAPEVLTGRYNSAVDIWSVGCVVIELAAGREPWAEMRFESTFAALYFIASHHDCLPVIPPSLSAAGHDFIRQCLTRDPDRRPTASQLLQHPFVTEEWEEKRDSKAAVEAAAASSGCGPMDVSASIRETCSATMRTVELTDCSGDEAMAAVSSSGYSSEGGVAVVRGSCATIGVMLDSGGSCDTTMERTLRQEQPTVRMQVAMTSPLP
jgi:serine/threonine protein kinase